MAQYKKFNITRAHEYESNTGEKKTAWRNVGMLTMFMKPDGSESGIVELNMFEEQYQVFPFVPRDEQPAANHYNQTAQPAPQQYNQAPQYNAPQGGGLEYPTDDINPEDIPF